MGPRLAGLLVKEAIQFLHDRVMMILILWLYTVEVVICTLALSFEVAHLPFVIVDLDRTPASRALVERFSATETFVPVGHLASAAEAEQWMQEGRARLTLVVPEGFQRDLARGDKTSIQVLLDGTNSNVAAQARTYAIEIAGRFRYSPIASSIPGNGVTPMVRVWYNPDQTYTSFMVLSMVALAALMVGVIHPAATIVREKETGTIEQLRVTPIRPGELLAAKTLPTLVMGLLSVFPSLLIVWWFDVPLRGSLALFLALTAVFLLSAISIGVMIAVITRTLQQALLLSFFGLFPVMFMSGTLAPIESMPDALQIVSLASPLRHYMDVILGIFLKGSGFAELWPQTLALIGIGAPLFIAAACIFEKTSQDSG